MIPKNIPDNNLIRTHTFLFLVYTNNNRNSLKN